MGLNPPPSYFKLFGAFLPIKPPEMPAIFANPLPAPQIPPRVTGAKRFRSDPNPAPAAKPPRNVSRKWPQLPPQPLPQRYRDFLVEIGGSTPTLIYTRTLYHSDVDKGLNRLNIPPKQTVEPFLALGQEDFIQRKSANKTPNKLRVKVVDPGLVVRTMSLAKWNWQDAVTQRRSWWYALTNNWMDVVRANGLVEGGSIQVWSFRINGELGFVIHKVANSQRAEGSTSNGDQSVVLDGSTSSGGDNKGDDQGGDPACSSSAVACAQ